MSLPASCSALPSPFGIRDVRIHVPVYSYSSIYRPVCKLMFYSAYSSGKKNSTHTPYCTSLGKTIEIIYSTANNVFLKKGTNRTKSVPFFTLRAEVTENV